MDILHNIKKNQNEIDNRHPSLKFTVECEKDLSIPFRVIQILILIFTSKLLLKLEACSLQNALVHSLIKKPFFLNHFDA